MATVDKRARFASFCERRGVPVRIQSGPDSGGNAGWAAEYYALIQDATGSETGATELDETDTGADGPFLASANPKVFRVPATHFAPYTAEPAPIEGCLINWHGRLYRITNPDPRDSGGDDAGTYALDLYAYKWIDRPIGPLEYIPGLEF